MQLRHNPAALEASSGPRDRLTRAVGSPGFWLAWDTLLQNLRILGGINFHFALWFFAGAPREAFNESGLIENVQALLLAIAVLILVRIAITRRGPARTAAIGFAFVCFAVCFREVDLRTFDAPGWIIQLTSGKIRNRLFFAASGALGVYLFLRRSHVPAILRQLFHRESRPLQVAIALVVIAGSLEDVFYHTRLNKFWEEGLEVIAYGLVLHAAIAGYWLPREPSAGASPAPTGKSRRGVRSLAAVPWPGSLRRSRRIGSPS